MIGVIEYSALACPHRKQAPGWPAHRAPIGPYIPHTWLRVRGHLTLHHALRNSSNSPGRDPTCVGRSAQIVDRLLPHCGYATRTFSRTVIAVFPLATIFTIMFTIYHLSSDYPQHPSVCNSAILPHKIRNRIPVGQTTSLVFG